jgi:predicted Zn-dependent protease
VVNENLGQLINMPLNAGSQLFLASYSRGNEKEADKGGTRLMAASGYDPTHFPVVLNNLSILIQTITGHEEEFTYFDSHPYTPKRVDYLNKEIEKLSLVSKAGIATDRDEFLQSLDGICVGENPDHGVFQENHFLHPGLDLHMSFPEGWLTVNKPSMVGALDTSDNQSMVVMGLAGDEMPETLGTQFAERLRKEHGVIPDRSEGIDLNGMPAYIVSLQDNTGGEDIRIHSLWFSLNELTFQVLGVAKESKTALLRNTALSIRTLTRQERETIHMHTLRIREAQNGESIEAFNARTGNMWSPEITAILNSIEGDAVLKKGQLIKVAVKERYVE